MSLKFRIVEIISFLTLMIHLKKHSDILKITLVLQIYRVKVLMQVLKKASQITDILYTIFYMLRLLS